MNYKKLFIKFMKKNKAFKEWKHEVSMYHLDCPPKYYIDEFLENLQDLKFAKKILDNEVSVCYLDSSKKGFWNNLNFKWKEELKIYEQ